MVPESQIDQAKHLNTPRLVADDTQKTVWKWEQQEPFGAGACNPDPDGDNVQFEFNLRFPGQYFDKETNAHYNYFRDYDPALGRYLQSDPIGLLSGPNTYSYGDGQPTGRVDALGLWSFSIEYYDVFGGGLVFGDDPNTGRFISIRAGVGFGGGFTWDPNGKRPGGEACVTGVGLGVSVNSQGAAGPGFIGGNLFSGGVNLNADPGRVVRGYVDSGPQYGFDWDPKRFGLRGTVNAAIEFTGFTKGQSCECSGRSR